MPEPPAPALRVDDWPDRKCFIIIREGYRKPDSRVDAPSNLGSAPFGELPFMDERCPKDSGGHDFDTACAVNGCAPSPHGRRDAGNRAEVGTNARPITRSSSMSELLTPARTPAATLRPASQGSFGFSRPASQGSLGLSRPTTQGSLPSSPKAKTWSHGVTLLPLGQTGHWQRSSKAPADPFGAPVYMWPGGLPQKKLWEPLPEPLPKSRWREWQP
mmetsp:Transcript_71828/g.126870  ORF Transcript_71828/g.126870 Transcript_71828/m.126870 type:complete len:216 (+) Transcript_71828:85-732(+)